MPEHSTPPHLLQHILEDVLPLGQGLCRCRP